MRMTSAFTLKTLGLSPYSTGACG